MRFLMSGARKAHLPQDWREALALPSHIFVGTILVVAKTKAHAAEMLQERGVSEWTAGNMATGLRIAPADRPAVAAFIEGGFVDADTPSVYAWQDEIDKYSIVRIEPNGNPTLVGRWRYEGHGGSLDSRSFIIEPAAGSGEASS